MVSRWFKYLALLILPVSSAAFPESEPDAEYVSLVTLIANAKQFDGRLVSVAGYMNLEWENSALFLHETDREFMFTKNAIWVTVPPEKRKYYRSLSHRYGIVRGVFHADQCGHMCLYSGSIDLARVNLSFKPAKQK